MIAESTAGKGAALDVFAGGFELFLGDVGAAIGRAAQGHHLPAGDGNVGVDAVDLISPTALIWHILVVIAGVLGVENEFGAPGQGLADFRPGTGDNVDHALGYDAIEQLGELEN